VDARNPEAVARLRLRKSRYDKPLAVMVPDLAWAQDLCWISDGEAALLTSPEAPIVLLERRSGTPVAENVAPGNPNLGVMLPYTPLHHLLLNEIGIPVVATSGNLSDEPICIDAHEAMDRLQGIADLYLVHDRPIVRHVDDSVTRMILGKSQILRRARGFAPLPVLVGQSLPVILGVGGHLKNSIALSIGRQVFMSQHIGDLETPQAVGAFQRVIADFLRLYEASPIAVAVDLHPDYYSTRWAQAWCAGEGTPQPSSQSEPPVLIPVQHHHAHLASCLAENGVADPALGVVWDGTGYGTDGTIWGGEFLLGDAGGFVRAASFRPFLLPGGERAIKEPARIALALLWKIYGDAILEWEDLAPIRHFRAADRRLLLQMIEKRINAPVTSSAGRLFDAVAALIGLHQRVTFEGQAAMALEYTADPGVADAYPFEISRENAARPAQSNRSDAYLDSLINSHQLLVLDWHILLEAILADVRRGVSASVISARFHNALVQCILQIALHVGIPRVALTGGCFQSRLLTERVAYSLKKAGFDVLLHHQVPPNDGGISLGQVMVAAARLGRPEKQEIIFEESGFTST
ncbi:MAG: carbamoyltransferase HypF, partial [Chloroflexi bacterium]|nr:carbamoyltransferase HypF [Chloroflexota bacterium]